MPAEKSSLFKSSANSSFIAAAIFIILAVIWDDASSLFRYAAGAAGIAFAIKGISQLKKKNKSGEPGDTEG